MGEGAEYLPILKHERIDYVENLGWGSDVVSLELGAWSRTWG